MSEVQTLNIGDVIRGIIQEAADEFVPNIFSDEELEQPEPIAVPGPLFKPIDFDNLPQTRVAKLNHLIDILERVKPIEKQKKIRFDMGQWVRTEETEECGFSGCAIGWSSIDPTFMAMGFHHEEGEIVLSDSYTGNRFSCMQAIQRFFELNGIEAYFLFMPQTYYPNQCPIDVLSTYPDEDLYYKNGRSRISIHKVIKRIEHVRDFPFHD